VSDLTGTQIEAAARAIAEIWRRFDAPPAFMPFFEMAEAALAAASIPADPPRADRSPNEWPTIEQQSVERSCTCLCIDPGSHLSPPEWEQDPYCAEHPAMQIVIPTVENLRAEVARLRAALTEVADLDCGTTRGAPWREKARAALGAADPETPQPRAELSETIVDRIARDAIETVKRAADRVTMADPETKQNPEPLVGFAHDFYCTQPTDRKPRVR